MPTHRHPQHSPPTPPPTSPPSLSPSLSSSEEGAVGVGAEVCVYWDATGRCGKGDFGKILGRENRLYHLVWIAVWKRKREGAEWRRESRGASLRDGLAQTWAWISCEARLCIWTRASGTRILLEWYKRRDWNWHWCRDEHSPGGARQSNIRS